MEKPLYNKGTRKTYSLCRALRIPTALSDEEVALMLCNHVEADFNRKYDEPSQIVETLAPKERKEVWRKLGIFPGGIYGEMMYSTSSCLTNVDGYYASLALKAMRLALPWLTRARLSTNSVRISCLEYEAPPHAS